MASSLVRYRFLLVVPAVLLLMGVMACGGEEPAPTPVPTPTPVNISAIVEQALAGQPQGVTAEDMARAIQSALAAQPGVSTQDVASEVAKVLSARPGVTTQDVATAIASALEERPGVTTQDVATEIARALRAQQPGVTEQQVASAIQGALEARPGVTEDQVAMAIENALAAQQTEIQGAVQSAVSAALMVEETGEPEGTIDVGRAELGAYICDPKHTAGVADVGMQGHETLFTVNTNDEIVPELAKSWDISDDMLTWTIELNRGIPFTKGYGELTAEDVVFTIMRGTEDGSALPRAGSLRGMWQNPEGSVEIDGDYTIRVNTGTPAVGMLVDLSCPYCAYILSKKQVEEVGWDAASDNCATTGPWDVAEHRTSNFFSWEAVNDHWRKTPEFAQLILHEVPEENTRLAGFQTEKLDTFVMAFDTLPEVQKLPGVKLMESSPGATMHFGIYGNYYVTERPGYDPSLPWISSSADVNSPEWEKARKVRKAMTIAIDRETIVNTLVMGRGEPLTLWGWENKEEKLPSGVKWSYDPEMAKQLLTEAGYPDGFDTRLMVYPRQVPGDVQACTAIGGMLEKVGIRVEMAPMPYASASPLIRGRDWSHLNCHGTNATREPIQLMGLMLSTSGFNMGFEHATVDGLVAEARVIFDVAARFDKEREVAQFVFDNALEAGVYTVSLVWPLGPALDPWFDEHQDRGDPRALTSLEWARHRR
jgi:ABC-type transport system substrate-binding protein